MPTEPAVQLRPESDTRLASGSLQRGRARRRTEASQYIHFILAVTKNWRLTFIKVDDQTIADLYLEDFH